MQLTLTSKAEAEFPIVFGQSSDGYLQARHDTNTATNMSSTAPPSTQAQPGLGLAAGQNVSALLSALGSIGPYKTLASLLEPYANNSDVSLCAR